MKTIGFIGMGNMARAIACGMIGAGAAAPGDLYAYAPHHDRLEAFCQPQGIHACRTVEDMLAQVDTVIMAVKPYIVERVLEDVRDALKGKALLSVVAGYDYARYQPLVDSSVRVQFIMPNTPCMVRAGVLLFEDQHSLTPDERAQAIALFQSLGEVVVLPSHLMGIGGAVSGCGPAFAAMVIEALADAGVKYGLPRATAYRLASQTLLGTGAMQLQTEMHPGQIKDGVCSPGGTTIRGVEALEAEGMRHAFFAAVKAIMEK